MSNLIVRRIPFPDVGHGENARQKFRQPTTKIKMKKSQVCQLKACAPQETHAAVFQLALHCYMQVIEIAESFRGLGILLIAKGFRPDVIFGERHEFFDLTG